VLSGAQAVTVAASTAFAPLPTSVISILWSLAYSATGVVRLSALSWYGLDVVTGICGRSSSRRYRFPGC
jgi:hypothetical protein